jgi:hypothetical protein
MYLEWESRGRGGKKGATGKSAWSQRRSAGGYESDRRGRALALFHAPRGPRAGATIAIVRGSIACPVEALKAWRDAAGITTGPVFRSIRKGGKVGARLSAQSVADIVKAHAENVGLDPALFAGHSLRAGFLTSAAKRGASIFKMMDQSRHRSVDTLRGYVCDAEIFKDHAGAGLL